MFELSVAFKYLLPRWRQLSVSIISLVSTLVIALVVWLIVVFFSVKDGLENSWVDKIIALTAPIRITPTEKYYESYYYLIDSVSQHSDYTPKSLAEKLSSSLSDPYNPDTDEELPIQWPSPDLNGQGKLKDISKETFQIATKLPGLKNLKVTDFETTFANIFLELKRPHQGTSESPKTLEQAAYVGSFDLDIPALSKALLPMTASDFQNLLSQIRPSLSTLEPQKLPVEAQFKNFFDHVTILSLKTPNQGWRIPLKLLPKKASFTACAIIKDHHIIRLIIPATTTDLKRLQERLESSQHQTALVDVLVDHNQITASLKGNEQALSPWISLMVDGGMSFSAHLIPDSIARATRSSQLRFNVKGKIQSMSLEGEISLGNLQIDKTVIDETLPSSLFAHRSKDQNEIIMPVNSFLGDPILLPKIFKESGAAVGDTGYLSYFSPTPSTVQEQRTPVFVSGFYDPGIMPIGGKFILANRQLIGLIRSSYGFDNASIGNGWNIRYDNLKETSKAKADLLQALKEAGLSSYWKVETYQEYDFTKDLIQQLHSEKNLFSLISLVIIIVACSNIISMLIILVNDKKLEIGILRSMGATSASIATIFGICGMVMGGLGSLIGIVAALLTLHYINELVDLMSRFQGYDLFNPVFYGHTLPSEISLETLTFVVITTAAISLLAGIVPAVKASMMRPSAILRSE